MTFFTSSHTSRARRVTTVVVAAAGVSSLLLWSAPANAVADYCGGNGTYIGNAVCEQIFADPGEVVFTPVLQMTGLQLLIVGGGGNGGQFGNGYGGGGGGVILADFDTESPITVWTGDQGEASTAEQGNDTITAEAGKDGGIAGGRGGDSGNGNLGANQDTHELYGAGAGAGAIPDNLFDGGAGVVVSSIATTPGSPFAGDTNCYAGGGPVAFTDSTLGTSSCGAGTVSVPEVPLVLATAALVNTGGGGAGIPAAGYVESSDLSGASGVVIARWKVEVPVTATFSLGGHGSAIDAITGLLGNPVAQPVDPTADGFTFTGWFTDAALTSKADFSLALTDNTTFYAGWQAVVTETVASPVLPETGANTGSLIMPLGGAVLLLGVSLLVVSSRRASAQRVFRA